MMFSTRISKMVLGLAMAGLVSLGMSSDVHADTILTFGQSTRTDRPIVATNTTVAGIPVSTTLTATNANVTITQLDNFFAIPPSVPPFPHAYLNFVFQSQGPATSTPNPPFANTDSQNFLGHFEITSGLNGTGTNYLSGALVSAQLQGTNNQTSLVFNNTVNPVFTSSVIVDLAPPTSAAFAFGNVNPSNHLVGLPGLQTFAAFRSSVSGTFGAQAVPEPSSLALLGLGAIGLVAGAYRRRMAV